jgi:rhomboid protease GluP
MSDLETQVFQANYTRFKWIPITLLLASITLIPLSVLLNDDSSRLLVLLGVLSFILSGTFWLLQSNRKPTLILYPSGFSYEHNFGKKSASWIEIKEINIFFVQNNRLIGFDYEKEFRRSRFNFNKSLGGFTDAISAPSGSKPEDLLALMRLYRERARQKQAFELAQTMRNRLERGEPSARLDFSRALSNAGQTAEAIAAYETLALEGDIDAQFELGSLLGADQGLEWIRHAKDGQGEPAKKAQEVLPDMLIQRVRRKFNAIPVDAPMNAEVIEAVHLYRENAGNGSVHAQKVLSVLLLEAYPDDPKIRAEAHALIIQAARSGDTEAFVQQRLFERPLVLRILPTWVGVGFILILLVIIFAHEIARWDWNLSVEALDLLGGTYFQAIQNGEVWRLVTATLLHANFRHIMYNAYALFVFGWTLEMRAGPSAILSAFVVCGVTASLFSSLLGSHNLVSVGASGAIFGIMGFRAVFGSQTFRAWLTGLQQNGLLILINLLLVAFIPGVDNFAHFGGVIAGLIFGFVWRNPPQNFRWTSLALSVIVLGYGAWKIFTSP